jgi:hypothetical protein
LLLSAGQSCHGGDQLETFEGHHGVPLVGVDPVTRLGGDEGRGNDLKR